MKIAELLLQMLEANGVSRIFGNPGTTEIPLVRLCERRRRLRYVVALSEVAAVPMADGYARATRSLEGLREHGTRSRAVRHPDHVRPQEREQIDDAAGSSGDVPQTPARLSRNTRLAGRSGRREAAGPSITR